MYPKIAAPNSVVTVWISLQVRWAPLSLRGIPFHILLTSLPFFVIWKSLSIIEWSPLLWPWSRPKQNLKACMNIILWGKSTTDRVLIALVHSSWLTLLPSYGCSKPMWCLPTGGTKYSNFPMSILISSYRRNLSCSCGPIEWFVGHWPAGSHQNFGSVSFVIDLYIAHCTKKKFRVLQIVLSGVVQSFMLPGVDDLPRLMLSWLVLITDSTDESGRIQQYSNHRS